MPKVSVVIPTYNRSAYLKEAVDSVLCQTYNDYEIIVVDDGSTDGTGEMMLHEYQDNGNIIYIYQSNKGSSAARNAGMRAARGEYIAFLDSDDLWLPDKIELQLKKFSEDLEVGLVFCGSEYLGRNGQTVEIKIPGENQRGHVLQELILSNFMPTPTVMIRRNCIDKAGFMPEGIVFGEDWYYWLKIASRYKVDYVGAMLVRFRDLTGGLSDISYERFKGNVLQVLDHMFADDALKSEIEPYRNKVYSNYYFRFGALLLGRKLFSEARRDFITSIRLNPLNLNSVRCLVKTFIRF